MKKKLFVMLIICFSVIFGSIVNADVMTGDVTADGIISARDALAVLKHAADIEKISEEFMVIADVNQDKRINAEDALHILKYAAGIIKSFEEVVVELEHGVIYHYEKYDVAAAEIKVADEETVKVISTFDEYEELINQYGEKVDLSAYSEEYFTENTLLCAVYRFHSCSWFDMTLEKIIQEGNDISLYLNVFGPYDQAETETYWTTFIPMEGKGWDEYNYGISVKELYNSTMNNGTGVESSSAYRTKNIAVKRDIIILSTYEEYLEYYKKLNDNIIVPEMDWYGSVLLGCKREFFDSNSIIVAGHSEISGSIDISCEKFVEEDGEWLIYLNKENKDGDVMTDDMAYWDIMIPVEGKDWAYKNIRIAEEKGDVVDVDYSKVQCLSVSCEDHNDTWTPRVRVISTFADYENYIKPIKEHFDNYPEDGEIYLYDESYFNENSLVVVDYTYTEYSTQMCFRDIEYRENKKVYQINIQYYGSIMQLPECRPWEIIIPFEGKTCTAADFKVNSISIVDYMGWALQSSAACPVEGYDSFEYPIVLDTYEEYQNYMELFKAANPNCQLKKEYKEADFEYTDIVVGGFWTLSGQLELEYVNTTKTGDELTINFNGKCPSTHTDDSYYYHFMIALDFISGEEDIGWNVDVEYY